MAVNEDVVREVSMGTGLSLSQVRAVLDLFRLYNRRSKQKGGL